MAEVTYSDEEDIQAPPETVFDYRLDYEKNLPQYNPNVSNMKRTDGGDELDNDDGRALIEQSGRRQARLELEHMKKNMEAS